MTFWQIVRASGVIGLLIFLLSVAGLALVIEHALTIRRAILMPPEFCQQAEEALRSGQVGRLVQAPECRTSALGRVLAAGLAELDLGWQAMEKALEEALAEESARLYRKVEYLSVIGNLAPMLGLLGTVVGMIVAFRQVAETQGAARAADLAEGIYLALVTTVEGLLVAIPALGAFAFFRNKVDALIAEVALTTDRLLRPIKRELLVSVPAPPRAGQASARVPRGS
ncbi:MAG: MotA/TolQ/ExbB proton channel family protein [Thermoguttaceae bacterium]|nr:MotA/TolQ/ExbB proton channel family protein [Thermoguttaceae bacterium]MDW8079570.1 MotA/TolQ/ExbB proton channel family protein [Thermoguttaceae bacterium]